MRLHNADIERAWQPRSPLGTPASSHDATATTQRTSTPTWTPTPTPTPYPASVVDDLGGEYPGLSPLVNKCIYHDRDCLILLWYDEALWEGILGQERSYLRHRSLDKCTLGFVLPRGDGSKVSMQTLAGTEWTVYWVGSNTIHYTGSVDSELILVGVGLPNAVDYRESEEDKGQCQLDIETVLETISVVHLKS